jgi:hypothetical protein
VPSIGYKKLAVFLYLSDWSWEVPKEILRTGAGAKIIF